MKELSKTEVVGQLYCHNRHVQRVYGYHNENELNHIATEVYIEDDCHKEDGVRLDVYNNQTGMLLTSYSDIPLVVDSDMAMSDYGLSYESLGTIFNVGVFSFAALVLMPLLEY